MYPKVSWAVFLLLFVDIFSAADEIWFDRIGGSAMQPLSSLPEHIKAQGDQVCLWADFEDVNDNRIAVYIINNSTQEVSIPTQDGDPFIKVESLHPQTQKWERAEKHQYSWCGNSYVPVVLPPRHYIVIQKLFPIYGELRPLRYRTFSNLNLISNSGRGYVDPATIENCRYDSMALQYGELELLRNVLLKNQIHDPELKRTAILSLRRFHEPHVVEIFHHLLQRTEDVEQIEFEMIIRSFMEAVPDDFKKFLFPLLRDRNSSARKRLLSASSSFNDPEFIALLEDMADKPDDPDLHEILRCLKNYNTQENQAYLLEVTRDAKYPSAIRKYAQYLAELTSEIPKTIRLEINVTEDNLKTHNPEIKVGIVNISQQDIPFPTPNVNDVLGVWLVQDKVCWNTDNLVNEVLEKMKQNALTPLVLKPGEKFETNLHPASFLDTDKEVEALVYVRCYLPDLHNLPYSPAFGYQLRMKK